MGNCETEGHIWDGRPGHDWSCEKCGAPYSVPEPKPRGVETINRQLVEALDALAEARNLLNYATCHDTVSRKQVLQSYSQILKAEAALQATGVATPSQQVEYVGHPQLGTPDPALAEVMCPNCNYTVRTP